MRLSTRFTILLLVSIIAVTTTVAWFAVGQSTTTQMSALETRLAAIARGGEGQPGHALSNVLALVQQGHDDVSVVLVSPSGSTTLYAGSTPLTHTFSGADVRAATNNVRLLSDLPGFAVIAIGAGGGDHVLIAASTRAIAKAEQHLEGIVALVASAVAVLALLIGQLVMRRDLRSMTALASYARDATATSGALDVPSTTGSREVRELREALTSMVDAQQRRLVAEQRSTRVMQEFLGDASHELRTPLTVIRGYTELLGRESVPDEQRRRAVERMLHEEQRMESLIGDLLLLAEVSELPTRSLETIDLTSVVCRRVAEFRDEQGRSVTTQVAPRLTIRARDDLMGRLLDNAFTNIVRYTDPTDPVRVSGTIQAGVVVLTIDDGGPGLPVYEASPQRFQRYDPSRSRETGGSGLGMSIMAGIAESFGGVMNCEPSDLGGVRLRFSFPSAT